MVNTMTDADTRPPADGGVEKNKYDPNQPIINNKCPACGWKTLFIGAGGLLTCSNVDCPEPDTEHAWQRLITQSRIDELERIDDSITKNNADRYPKIDPENTLTYVSHGHAVACKQMRRNISVRIASLQQQTNGGRK